MKKQFLITKISKHLLYAMLVAVTFGGCIRPKIMYPLVVSGIQVNESQNVYPFKYVITFKGVDVASEALFYTDTKYNVGDTLK